MTILKNVFFASLGCSKNLVDSEVMLGILEQNNFIIVDDPNDAHIIVVNTCGFIHDAKEESVNTILEMVEFKVDGDCEVLAIAGCLTQRHSDELKKEIPEIDIFIGTGEYQNIGKLLSQFQSTHEKIVCVNESTYIHSENDPRINTSPFYSAWLKIAEGCSRRCSFCIIPHLRGSLRSRSVDSLVVEAKSLVESGVLELNLISQDTSLYGKDLSEDNSLYNLLVELEKIEGLKWIRLFYIYPDDLTDDVIELMGRSNKICKYLDIPIQHFSDPVLKGMNRKITGEKIIERVEMLREKVPNITLRTSLLVGFPGETEDDFQLLLDGIERLKFNHVGVFAFSREEGTVAFDLPSDLTEDTILDRQRDAYALQEDIIEEINSEYIGKTIEVLIEGEHEETELLIVGRHEGQAPEIDGKVIINDLNGHSINKGDLVKVKVSEVLGFDLVGCIESTQSSF